MTTEAGRRLLAALESVTEQPIWRERIAAIEAKARATLLAELEAGVREMADGFGDVSAAAVLDLIRKAGK